MSVFETIHEDNFEKIIFCNDKRVGLKAIIGIHNTVLGPATGGCRMWSYKSETEALTDVTRLAKGMSYKASISKLTMGGGKSVIMGDASTKTPEMLARFGELVEELGGRYITAKDVGINSDDLKQMKTKTRHILGVAGEENSSGDPSPVTAWGVYNGMKACANAAFGSRSLKGKTIALQGLGSVNYYLAKHLDEEGAKLIGSDIDKGAAARAEKEFGMQIVDVNGIYDVDCDVFSPGALGAIINETTIPKLRCKIVAGAANNQLATTAAGDALFERGILYAPDYAINAGGLINIFHEREGYSHDRAWSHVAGIYDTVGDILARSVKDKTPEYIVADKISQERIDEAEEKLGRKP